MPIPYICVHDARAAIAWYQDVLGAHVVVEPMVMDDGSVGHAELALGDERLMLSEESLPAGVQPPDPQRGNPVTLLLEVADVDDLAARAADQGARIDRGPVDDGPGRLAVLHDPFGHRWFLLHPAG